MKDYTGTGPSYRIWTLSEGRSSKLGGAALDVAFAWFMGTRPGACRGRPLLLSR